MRRHCSMSVLFIVITALFVPSAFAEKKGGSGPRTSHLNHVPAPLPKSRLKPAHKPASEPPPQATSIIQERPVVSQDCDPLLAAPKEAPASKKAAKKPQLTKLPPGSTVVLDTNVWMKYPQALDHYMGMRVVIPKQVVVELDNNNHRHEIAPETKANIRSALRVIKALAVSKGPWSGPVQEIDLNDGTGTRVVFDNRDHLAELKNSETNMGKTAVSTLRVESADDRIIAAAVFYHENKGSIFQGDVALVTGDGVATMSALQVGLNALEHSTEAHYSQEELDGKIYNGRLLVDLRSKDYDKLAGLQTIEKSHLQELTGQGLRLYPNQFLIFLRPGDRKIYEEYIKGEGDGLPHNQVIGCYNAQKDVIEIIRVYGAQELPIELNLEQRMALYAALNPRIRRVIMMGKAGTGKTVVALLAARMQLSSTPVTGHAREQFESIVISKTDDEVGGRKIGFLPGPMEDKLAPVYASYKDALTFLISREKKLSFSNALERGGKLKGENTESSAADVAEQFMSSGKVEITNLGFFLGRTFRHRMVLFDEAQNLSPDEMKTLATRIGEKSKLIVMGDVNQIVGRYNDRNNGLSDLISLTAARWSRNLSEGREWERGADQTAVVKLVRSRREVLVEWTTQLYDEQDN